jgi:hypothetical protein
MTFHLLIKICIQTREFQVWFSKRKCVGESTIDGYGNISKYNQLIINSENADIPLSQER